MLYIMAYWRGMPLFFDIKIWLSLLLLEGSKIVNAKEREREREREEDVGRRLRLAEDCYIDSFVTHVMIPCSGS